MKSHVINKRFLKSTFFYIYCLLNPVFPCTSDLIWKFSMEFYFSVICFSLYSSIVFFSHEPTWEDEIKMSSVNISKSSQNVIFGHVSWRSWQWCNGLRSMYFPHLQFNQGWVGLVASLLLHERDSAHHSEYWSALKGWLVSGTADSAESRRDPARLRLQHGNRFTGE